MMNESTASAAYLPVQAWLVYQLRVTDEETGRPNTFSSYSVRDAPEFYLEEHEIYPDQQGAFRLSAGAPLSQERVGQVCQAIRSEGHPVRAFKGLIPSQVLFVAYEPEVLIWKVKASVRKVQFSLKGLPDHPVWIPCPALVFRVEGNTRLSVYATKASRLTEQSVLYQAPFPNIADGRVCLGSARSWIKEPSTFQGLMKQWEEIFFASTFNSDGSQGRAKVSLPALWKPLIAPTASEARPFPKHQLRAAPRSLASLLKQD